MNRKTILRLLRQRARIIERPVNPLEDPIAHIKRPLKPLYRDQRGQGVVRPGQPVIEFSQYDVQQIRLKFLATQNQFARIIGISRETLRNWERGRRRPHGPARALLRAIDADPVALARALNWHARHPQDEPDEWMEMD
ncbi:MAG TPA: helix-turn-helix domain-containing protein [Vicinamibacterales bacterium]|nr:helix-turn-helix domain-containing protein [Vicinamibacterales bacterium]